LPCLRVSMGPKLATDNLSNDAAAEAVNPNKPQYPTGYCNGWFGSMVGSDFARVN
jgi:hypothetical protein